MGGSAPTTSQIGKTGEQIVTEWLKSKGYQCVQNTKLPGSTDIEANSGTSNLLVQVKTAIYPSTPSEPSSDEIRNIKSRASNTGREAWTAKVTINSQGQLVGNIEWSKL
jgi:Holliday junction resolvase-like predicted endonuclease